MEKDNEKIVSIEEGKAIDDKDLDEFEKLEEELEEEKKEEKTKINWKKILPFVGVGLLGYLIGKKNRRFIFKNDGYSINLPNIDNWDDRQKMAINDYISALNDGFAENAIVLCVDKKRKIAAQIKTGLRCNYD